MAAARTANKTRKPSSKRGRTGGGQRAATGSAKRKSAARGRRRPPTRATRSLVASRPSLRGMRDLEPHQIDVLALAMIALGIFLGGVAYGLWAGGALGHGMLSGLELLIGKLAYLTPVALVLAGARVLARDTDFAPATRPLRSGMTCLVAGTRARLRRGHARARSGPDARRRFLGRARLKPRGGLLGGIEFYVACHLLSTVGADILAVFMLIAGGILLSGATFASVINNSRHHASTAMRSRVWGAQRHPARRDPGCAPAASTSRMNPGSSFRIRARAS